MSCTLPPEILDLIVDHLQDAPTTLRTCCVVSKSWVPRTRKHIFACVELDASESHIELWKKSFPDPSNSPAHYTRALSVWGVPITPGTDLGPDKHPGGWIRTFCNVVHLRLSRLDQASLVPFYGLSPTLKSLHLAQTHPGVFDLICSFPLLEDLTLVALLPDIDTARWSTPSTSPKLTGTLDLSTTRSTRSVVRWLLDLPNGLHFSGINIGFFHEDAEWVADLVSRCSETLEWLSILCYPPSAFQQS